MPSANNANWAAYTVPAANIKTVTCGGNAGCTIPTQPVMHAQAVTSAASAASTTITFAAVPPNVLVGQFVTDLFNPIATGVGNKITAVSATTVTVTTAVTVASGDNIGFSVLANVAAAVFKTDPVPVAVPASGGYIKVNWYVALSTGQQVALSLLNRPTMGEFYNSSAAQTDRTATAASLTTGVFPTFGALTVLGAPAAGKAAPLCAVVAGDSISVGLIGRGWGFGNLTVTSGGTGYTSADVGQVFTINNVGASTYATITSARGMIDAVSGGAVTAAHSIDPGVYTNPTLVTGATTPTGAQTITANTVGTGATFTGSVVGAYDPGDNFRRTGFHRSRLRQHRRRDRATRARG